MIRILTSVFCLIVFSFTAHSQTVWKADPANSNVQFEVTHLAISSVTGKFTAVECTLTTDGEDFDGGSIKATVKVNDINTGNVMRDKHLKEDDFFNSTKFPEMTFESTKFNRASANRFQMTGNLTIRDVTKEITFPVEYSGTIELDDKTITVFKAAFSINRFDYNLKWDDTLDTGSLVVGEDVKVTLSLEFVKR